MRRRLIVVYPGRFQVPHKGHLQNYRWLRNKFKDVYIATSNKQELPDSPFSFKDKKRLLEFLGLPKARIVETVSPNNPKEITRRFPKDSVLIIAAGEKDRDRYNGFAPNKDGSQKYFQEYDESIEEFEGYETRAYVIFLPTVRFMVNGKLVNSATSLRDMIRNETDDLKQKEIIRQIFGKYDLGIHKILKTLE
jgi:hypothetical protein